MNNYIDNKICKQCKLCVEVCPCNCIEVSDDNVINFLEEKESICQSCGQCMAICSTKAIQIDGISYKDDLFDLPQNQITHSNFIDFLSNRRSVRNFKNKPVPDELINKILEAVWFAPFGSHPEKVQITVLNDRSKIEEALPYMANFMDDIVKLIDNPIASFFVKRKVGKETFNTIKNHLYPIAKSGNYKLEYGDRISRGAPAVIVFHAEKGAEAHTNNSLIYCTYAMLAAHSLGLGATMIEIIPSAINRVEKLRNMFKIPKNNEAIMSLVVGYPKYKYKRGVKRAVHEVEFL